MTQNINVEKVAESPELFVLTPYDETLRLGEQSAPMEEFPARAALQNTGMPEEYVTRYIEEARMRYEAEYAEAVRRLQPPNQNYQDYGMYVDND